jgi:hypothetical protein
MWARDHARECAAPAKQPKIQGVLLQLAQGLSLPLRRGQAWPYPHGLDWFARPDRQFAGAFAKGTLIKLCHG